MTRLEVVMQRISGRPALIRMQDVSDSEEAAAPYRTEGGIAFINICGPLFGEEYAAIQNQLNTAGSDPEVKGALLNFNSPGGGTDMAFETADMVAQLAAKKPVYGVAATKSYSAAYLLASQCTKVYVSPVSGGVGSIGVKCYHADFSGALKQAGIKITAVSAGEGKTDGDPYEPLSDAGKEQLQGEVDRLYGQFIGAVARGRGILPQDLVGMGARVFNGGTSAVVSGLADAVGDLSTAFNDICAVTDADGDEVEDLPIVPGFGMAAQAAVASSEKENVSMADINVEEVTAAAEAKATASALEIVELCAIAGAPALAGGFIAGKKSVADVRKELMAARVAADKGTELNTGVMPGADASAAGAKPGVAKPWGVVFKALGIKTKESV